MALSTLSPALYSMDVLSSGLQKFIARGMPKEAIFCAVQRSMSGYANAVFSDMANIALTELGIASPDAPYRVLGTFKRWKKVMTERKVTKASEVSVLPFTLNALIALAYRFADTTHRTGLTASASLYASQVYSGPITPGALASADVVFNPKDQSELLAHELFIALCDNNSDRAFWIANIVSILATGVGNKDIVNNVWGMLRNLELWQKVEPSLERDENGKVKGWSKIKWSQLSVVAMDSDYEEPENPSATQSIAANMVERIDTLFDLANRVKLCDPRLALFQAILLVLNKSVNVTRQVNPNDPQDDAIRALLAGEVLAKSLLEHKSAPLIRIPRWVLDQSTDRGRGLDTANKFKKIIEKKEEFAASYKQLPKIYRPILREFIGEGFTFVNKYKGAIPSTAPHILCKGPAAAASAATIIPEAKSSQDGESASAGEGEKPPSDSAKKIMTTEISYAFPTSSGGDTKDTEFPIPCSPCGILRLAALDKYKKDGGDEDDGFRPPVDEDGESTPGDEATENVKYSALAYHHLVSSKLLTDQPDLDNLWSDAIGTAIKRAYNDKDKKSKPKGKAAVDKASWDTWIQDWCNEVLPKMRLEWPDKKTKTTKKRKNADDSSSDTDEANDADGDEDGEKPKKKPKKTAATATSKKKARDANDSEDDADNDEGETKKAKKQTNKKKPASTDDSDTTTTTKKGKGKGKKSVDKDGDDEMKDSSSDSEDTPTRGKKGAAAKKGASSGSGSSFFDDKSKSTSKSGKSADPTPTSKKEAVDGGNAIKTPKIFDIDFDEKSYKYPKDQQTLVVSSAPLSDETVQQIHAGLHLYAPDAKRKDRIPAFVISDGSVWRGPFDLTSKKAMDDMVMAQRRYKELSNYGVRIKVPIFHVTADNANMVYLQFDNISDFPLDKFVFKTLEGEKQEGDDSAAEICMVDMASSGLATIQSLPATCWEENPDLALEVLRAMTACYTLPSAVGKRNLDNILVQLDSEGKLRVSDHVILTGIESRRTTSPSFRNASLIDLLFTESLPTDHAKAFLASLQSQQERVMHLMSNIFVRHCKVFGGYGRAHLITHERLLAVSTAVMVLHINGKQNA